jgi:hypothetical protein
MPLTTVAVNMGGTGAQTPVNAQTNLQTLGFKNRIINGAMGIWQRGTSGFTSSGNYSADRFYVQTGTSLSAVGQSSDVPSGFRFSLSVAGTNQPSVVQRIESFNCTDLVGQAVTISFWLKQTVSAGSNAMYIWLGYANSQDSFGSVTNINAVNISTTSSWVQYTATFTNLPSQSANGLQLIIGSNGSGANTFLITGVQLEKGSNATTFDYRPFGTELALCQRYFEQLGPGCPAMANSTTQYWTAVSYRVSKRAAPTVSLVSTTIRYFQFGISDRDTSSGTIANTRVDNTNSGLLLIGGFSSLTAGTSAITGGAGSQLNDGMIFNFSAEL